MVEPYTYIDHLSQVDEAAHTTPCKSIYEFYRLQKGKKAVKAENIEADIGRQYLVYSSFSERYYLRTLTDEKEIEGLKYEVDMGVVYLVWDKERQEGVREAMKASFKHLKGSEGTFTYYKQFVPLIANVLLEDRYKRTQQESIGYITKLTEFENSRKKIIDEL